MLRQPKLKSTSLTRKEKQKTALKKTSRNKLQTPKHKFLAPPTHTLFISPFTTEAIETPTEPVKKTRKPRTTKAKADVVTPAVPDVTAMDNTISAPKKSLFGKKKTTPDTVAVPPLQSNIELQTPTPPLELNLNLAEQIQPASLFKKKTTKTKKQKAEEEAAVLQANNTTSTPTITNEPQLPPSVTLDDVPPVEITPPQAVVNNNTPTLTPEEQLAQHHLPPHLQEGFDPNFAALAAPKKNSKSAVRAKLAAAAAAAAQEALDAAEMSASNPELDLQTVPPPDTVIVNDQESAQRVLAILMHPDVRKRYHACDTETTGIDPKIQSPVGHGTVICASIYVGPDVDFGGGSRVWIDNYGKAAGTLDLFKEYFEAEDIKKVWHNYSFDRHILYNHDINVLGFGGDTMHMARLWNSGRTGEGGNYGLESLTKDLVHEIPSKESMSTRFGYRRKLKNGDAGKVVTVPSTLELQLNPEYRTEWIDYSVRDAQATWYLRERLEHELKQWPWTNGLTMMDFYVRYWLPFGEMLTDMERVGIYVRRNDYLPALRIQAEKDRKECEDKFMDWAKKIKPECVYMNPGSEQQKQQLFFGPVDENDVHKSGLEVEREFETENIWGYIEPGKDKPKKNFKWKLRGLGMPVIARTPLGKPQVNIQVLKELAGNPFGKTAKYGKAFDYFGGGDAGKEACEAIFQLVKLAGIEITITTFIEPLTVMPDQNNRVHCSLNLNTETGRLSARKPNLQNQPSMDKDIYKIREAFAAEKGNKLIVADYGQLELRVLAHITKCKSMIEAFKLGGDFHSRTAMGMYKNIADAVANGDVLLEWDYTKGDPPKPLLKDVYGNERKKAKILNFSIAYGKTARGLAADFGVSVEEAKATVDAWYASRPEVLEWQRRTIAEARRTGVTRTLMGRYRPVHGINAGGNVRGHAERMAINTPIQGGAADIVMAGMIKLHRNQELRDLGYKILLQIHDELIVEGPEEHKERALEIVKECMCHPFKNDLLVDLIVDADIGDSWYEAK